MKKQKRTEGDFVKIMLKDNSFAYGRVLKSPIIAFYDLNTTNEASIETIIKSPILFKVCVMVNTITSGRWPIIGHSPLSEELLQPVAFVNQDPISKRIYKLVDSVEMDVSKEEAMQLERAAVWSDCHIEKRLLDHFSGIENRSVKSLKVKFD